jgi:hypothetical protein
MELATPALEPAEAAAPPAPIAAPPPTSIADLDRAAADLAERAGAFARTPPREKAALAREVIPRTLAAARDLARTACGAVELDPDSGLAGGAWLTGPVAILLAARALAASLDDIATNGRPELPVSALRGRLDGRLVADFAPRTASERTLARGTAAHVMFADDVEPEDAIAGQAAFYRRTDPEGSVALSLVSSGPPAAGALAALSSLFVDGEVALVEIGPARAHLAPILERALAPLVERGFVRIVIGGATPGAHLSSHAAVRTTRTLPSAFGETTPVLVVPCYYARDELWFLVRRFASSIALGTALDVVAPRVFLIAGHGAQRRLFLDELGRALDALPKLGPAWSLRTNHDPATRLGPREIGVIDLPVADDAIAMIDAAIPLCNEHLGEPRAAEIVTHPVHEEDPEIVLALARAVAQLRAREIGINQWPALLPLAPDLPSGGLPGARMLARVDKAILRGPLRVLRRPAYFYDNDKGARLGELLAAFHAAPGLGSLLGVLRR